MNESENNPVEVMPGMTTEQMQAVFFDANALKEPNYKLYQLNSDGHRYYYRYEENKPVFYPSVTTLLKQVMPISPILLDWMIKNGSNAAEKRDLAAAYGTFMHAQFERLLVQRCIDLDAVAADMLQYIEQNNLPEKFFSENIQKIRKDICAFAQFVKDYNVRPLAIEVALVHPEKHYAGMLDLPCVMTDPKSGDDFRAIVDFKSGRKGFFEEHELQLFLYREMWNVNFPDAQIYRLFNFSPKDWRGTKPTYNLQEQTDKPSFAKIPALLELGAIADSEIDNTFTVVSGVIELDNFEPKNNIVSLSLAELITSRAQNDEAPKTSVVIDAPETTHNKPKREPTTKHTPEPKKAVTEKKSDNLSNLLNGEIEL